MPEAFGRSRGRRRSSSSRHEHCDEFGGADFANRIFFSSFLFNLLKWMRRRCYDCGNLQMSNVNSAKIMRTRSRRRNRRKAAGLQPSEATPTPSAIMPFAAATAPALRKISRNPRNITAPRPKGSAIAQLHCRSRLRCGRGVSARSHEGGRVFQVIQGQPERRV